MKKLILVLILAVVVAGGVFAQEQGLEQEQEQVQEQRQEQGQSSNVRNNWLSAELSLLGGGARYERMLGPNFSIGANIYFNTLFLFWNELEFGLFGRFYPWGKTFFAEIGLGYHVHTSLFVTDVATAIEGGSFTPAVGWKIDVGNPGGFFIQPGIRLPITFGLNQVTEEFGVGVGIVLYIGLGGAF